jgi:hypothetical protein
MNKSTEGMIHLFKSSDGALDLEPFNFDGPEDNGSEAHSFTSVYFR